MKTSPENIIDLTKRLDVTEGVRLSIIGLVQGVGFRPFVYRLAGELHLSGRIRNSRQGVEIELEGRPERLTEFIGRLKIEHPPHARIDTCLAQESHPVGCRTFAIVESDETSAGASVQVTPDLATCDECLREIRDPADRRYRYPFTNCTNCGPRFSIVEALPYDRANTTMKAFIMCDECREEYENPVNRRFHAQPNACPKCGPHLELWDRHGIARAKHDQALRDACACVIKGGILALKGLGGFQLIVAAGNDDAIKRLRKVKARVAKPLALMCADLKSASRFCEIADPERELLQSPESPIVLMRRRRDEAGKTPAISPLVAPDSPYLGIMLPYTPLHHLMMTELEFPIVATSGNLCEEPICIEEHEAVERLKQIADFFLVHNRPIARQMDDSVVQFVAGNRMTLRSARGCSPVTVRLKNNQTTCFAAGADMKNAVALSNGENATISQHIGDLSTRRACDVFQEIAGSLAKLYGLSPEKIVCDSHPDYHSVRLARRMGRPVIRVQHHLAHIMACVVEHDLELPVLGVSWDGTGYGTDGTIWGGEFLRVDNDGFSRVATLRRFRLPGNEEAIREPRRAALGVLYEILGDAAFTADDIPTVRAFNQNELKILQRMLQHSVNAPSTSSMGRLFDVIASLTGLGQISSYEGQAAAAVQYAAEACQVDDGYEYAVDDTGLPVVLNWEPMILSLLRDKRDSISPGMIAAKFHNTMVQMILTIAERVGLTDVILTGGCCQNRYLVEHAINTLKSAGYVPHIPRVVPPNDGGIALGQLAAVACRSFKEI